MHCPVEHVAPASSVPAVAQPHFSEMNTTQLSPSSHPHKGAGAHVLPAVGTGHLLTQKPVDDLMPQPPQLLTSVVMSMHVVPPHRSHSQTPPWQVSIPVQGLPHPPQLASSDDVSAQPLGHNVSGGRHLQTPPLQASFVGHTVPHWLQLSGSL